MSETPAFARIVFYNGKLLTAEDLNHEQEYVRGKQKLHNRSLHGFGIVSGLRVTVAGGKVVVDSGLALDCEGNEIVVGTPQTLSPLSATESARTAYVNVRYVEEKTDLVPARGAPETSAPQFATIIESFEVCFGQENCTRGHRHLRARWLACGKPHALTLAKLRHNSQGWRVDRRYRAPVIK